MHRLVIAHRNASLERYQDAVPTTTPTPIDEPAYKYAGTLSALRGLKPEKLPSYETLSVLQRNHMPLINVRTHDTHMSARQRLDGFIYTSALSAFLLLSHDDIIKQMIRNSHIQVTPALY